MITLRNGLILSDDKSGFESYNHLTNKIDPKSYTAFKDLPDIFYKEINEDDRVLLNGIADTDLATILERTKR